MGMLLAVYSLYGFDADKMFKYVPLDEIEEGFGMYTVGETIADLYLDLASANTHGDLPIKSLHQTWLEYIYTIEPSIRGSPQLFDYTCVLNGSVWVLASFKTKDFLEGVLAVCKWFNVDYHQLITQLHYKDTPISLDSLQIHL